MAPIEELSKQTTKKKSENTFNKSSKAGKGVKKTQKKTISGNKGGKCK